MRLLLLCPHFEPDLHAATGEVMSKLAHSLGDRGHRVDIVTSLPWYRDHDVHEEWRGRPVRVAETELGSITRVWPFPTDKTNIGARAAGFVGFTGLVAGAAIAQGRPDAIMAMSPPIFLADAGWAAAKRFRLTSRHPVPFVFNVQDIFPDVAVDLGALTNPKVISAAQRYERAAYRRADAVTVLSEDQAANVRAKLPADQRHKVEIIQNFADTDRVSVVDRSTQYRQAHNLGDKFVVMYSGNVGLSQSFDLVRHAAERYASRDDIQFVINGEGAARPEVDGWAASMDNVTVSDFAPREAVSDVLGSADLHLILLKTGLSRSSTPSKLYGILAAGRPTLASIDMGSEVANALERAEAGRSVPPDSPDDFLAALDDMINDRSALQVMGGNGRRYVDECLTPEAQAGAYEELFSRLISLRSS